MDAFSFRNAADSQINLNAGDLVITRNVFIDSSSTAFRRLDVTGNDTTRRTVTIAGSLLKGGDDQDPDVHVQNNKRLLVTGSISNGVGNDPSIFIESGVLEFGSTGAMTGGSPVIGATGGATSAALWLNSAGSAFSRQIEIRGGSSGQRAVGGLNTSGTVIYSGNFVASNAPADYDLKAATGGTVNISGARNLNTVLQVNRDDGATTFGGTVILSGTTNSAQGTGLYAGTLEFGGPITGAGGNVGVEAGMLILTASSSYSGGTVVAGGTLEVSGNGSAGGSASGLGTGTVSIGAGGQVRYWLSLSGSNTIANPFSLSGGTLHTTDGFNTYSGRITLASDSSTISAQYEDTITLSGGLAGSGNVLFTQTGGTGAFAAPTYVLSASGSNTGTVRVSGSSGGGATKLQLADVNALQSATLDLATGDQGIVEFTAAGTNTYALGGLQGSRNLAIGSNSLSVGGNGTSTTYAGNLSGSGGLSKRGSGMLTLGGSNSYAGTTSVMDGELRLNGSIAGGLNVALIAVLSGTGTVGGDATIIGTHSPGNSPGVQTFDGDLTYVDGAIVEWELIANTSGSAGTNYDQIVLTAGNLTFSGTTTLALSFNGAGSTVDWSDPFWDVNRVWMVYDLSGGTTSGLSNLDLGGSLLDSQSSALSPTGRGYFTTSLVGQDVMLEFVAVPEPSTWALALAGFACGAGIVSQRRLSRAPCL